MTPEEPPGPNCSGRHRPVTADRRQPPAARFLRAGLARILASVSRLSGLSICLHDLAGFTREAGRRILPANLYLHHHPFCARLKSRRQPACYRGDFERANRRAGELRRVFVKKCHAGALEAVVPVFISGNHVGTLFAGPAAERGRPLPGGGRSLPVRSRRELLEVGRLLAVVAGYAAEAAQALMLEGMARAARSEPVRRATALAERRYGERLTVADAAGEAYLSPSRFAHVFAAETGLPFHRYLAALRVEKARGLLAHSSLRITEVAARCGFCNQNYFAGVFRARTGMTPTEYRRKQQQSIDI
jgi:AraC-like DNA-binding protein